MSARTPLLVGLVLILGIGGLTYFFMATNKDKFDEESTYSLFADFQDASGIRGKTRVQINGIDVGKIAKIEHVRAPNKRLIARVTMRIAKEYEIYDDAQVRKAAESLLGDFRIDLDPGTFGHRKLAEGEGIADVHSLSDIDEIKDQMVQMSHHVNDITQSFSKVLGGPEGEGSLKAIMSKVETSMANIEATTRSLQHTIGGNDEVLSRIITNVGQVSDALAVVSAPGGDFRTVAHNLSALTAKLDVIAQNINGIVSGPDATSPDTGKDVGNLKATIDNLNETVGHLAAVTRKVDEGQGTLGRVVNDSGIADRVENTLDSANQIIGSIAGLETRIELRSEYDVPFGGANNQVQPSIKNTLGLRIFPKPDKFYVLEAVADPRGRQTRSVTTAQVGNSQVVTNETITSFNDLKFSAMFAKRYFFATLRFGITENTGGLGLDFHALHDSAEVRLDAYDFSRRDPTNTRPIFPRLKVTGIYEVANHVHAQLGIDDPFNTGLRTWFLGGVLRFTDDDLKGMLAIAPRP